ncbi:hypothetical protein FLP10_15310 [Agromyces intestinalis]|uniref:Amino acid-binding ACT domain-containing protein n=1 Tax=Agromyces intestinalis TaxID=2592652 RepID=A0A5C1YI43_9MICO|nr:hypothetical protein [Agromyces intestinalis]QEO15641.1 hypothetical protein FLP10_15310 [Agromyces intestinalis]
MSRPEHEPGRDLAIALEQRPGALAEFAAVIAAADVNLEGGGAWGGVAHFLVDDGERAAEALRTAGYDPVVTEVVATRLDQGRPGTLAALLRRLGDAGIDLVAQYSDHDGRLILVVDEPHREAARRVVATSGQLDLTA